MEHFISFVIGIGVLVLQYFICKRGPVYIGAVLPIMYIGFLIYGYVAGIFVKGSTSSLLGAAFGGTLLLLSSWAKAREALAKERKRELTKMKAMDL
ncbi:hypothetical protein ACFDTO_32795 [Microbacteriaceae bacterium 4G12]